MIPVTEDYIKMTVWMIVICDMGRTLTVMITDSRYYFSTFVEGPRKTRKTVIYFVGILEGTSYISLINNTIDIFSSV
jgi:hypothetical protein